MKKYLNKKTVLILSIYIIIQSCSGGKENNNQNDSIASQKTTDIADEKPIEIQVEYIDASSIPSGLDYKGKIIKAARWQDKLGKNIFIATETGIYTKPFKVNETDEEVGDNAEVYAYNFLTQSDAPIQLWKMNDYQKDCLLDIEAKFVENTFEVTDLNNNGIAETWVMYVTTCTGDISPKNMKIIMHEGQKKFAMRGTNKVQYAENQYMGGEYTFDDAFLNGPSIFRDHAKNKWNSHLY